MTRQLAALTAGVLFWAHVLAQPEPSVSYRTSQERHFEIVGPDFAAVQSVQEIASAMETLGRRKFGITEAPLRPVSLQLNTVDPDTVAVAFSVKFYADGEAHVLIAWHEYVSFVDICQAVATGYLRQHSRDRDTSKGATVPDWLELATALELVTLLKPAVEDSFRERTLAADWMEGLAVLEARGPFGERLDAVRLHAYWMQEFISFYTIGVSDERLKLTAFLRGRPWQEVLANTRLRDHLKPDAFEVRWATDFQNIVRGREPPYFSMGESRTLVQRAAAIVAQLEGADRRLIGTQLWRWRENDRVRTGIRERLRTLKLDLLRINPVYQNALHSLGRCMEAILGDDEEAFREQQNQFISDMKAALNTQQELEKLLDW